MVHFADLLVILNITFTSSRPLPNLVSKNRSDFNPNNLSTENSVEEVFEDGFLIY
jgi:hypothetical protein